MNSRRIRHRVGKNMKLRDGLALALEQLEGEERKIA